MIRAATAADCAAIADIWNPVIRDTLVTFTTAEKTEAGLAATLAEKAAAGHGFLVAEAGVGSRASRPTASSARARAMRARWNTA